MPDGMPALEDLPFLQILVDLQRCDPQEAPQPELDDRGKKLLGLDR